MSKQTKKAGSKFGGDWTKQKLFVIDEYLKQYSKVLKNTRIRKIYVDAFAGSGMTEIVNQHDDKNTFLTMFDMFPELINTTKPPIPQETLLEGSALLSLKYDFDEFYFLEIDKDRISSLQKSIAEKYPDKLSKVHIIIGDSNIELSKVIGNITVYDRCLMFLDPYALELNWETLMAIAGKTGIDLWYLFPLNALTRVIPKDAAKMNTNEKIVSKILGTDDWKSMLYETTGQTDFFGNEQKTRIQFDKLIHYVIERFGAIFPAISNNYAILKNDKRSPLFLLCFMMTNTSANAKELADRLVQGIKTKLEKTYGKN